VRSVVLVIVASVHGMQLWSVCKVSSRYLRFWVGISKCRNDLNYWSSKQVFL
jgi:hypothetical protein